MAVGRMQSALLCSAIAALAAAAPAAQQQPNAKGFCARYARFGLAAVEGCHACEKSMPEKVPACMKCGTTCKKMHCSGPSDASCGKKQAFKACHAKCTAAPAAQQQPAAAKKPADPKACSKYATLGPPTAKGCEICHKFMPLKVDTCMSCGTKCRKQVCGGKDS